MKNKRIKRITKVRTTAGYTKRAIKLMYSLQNLALTSSIERDVAETLKRNANNEGSETLPYVVSVFNNMWEIDAMIDNANNPDQVIENKLRDIFSSITNNTLDLSCITSKKMRELYLDMFEIQWIFYLLGNTKDCVFPEILRVKLSMLYKAASRTIMVTGSVTYFRPHDISPPTTEPTRVTEESTKYASLLKYACANLPDSILASKTKNMPRECKKALDLIVSGQDRAKTALINAGCIMIEGIKKGFLEKSSDKHIVQPLLFIGPSGCGKSMLIASFAKTMGLKYFRLNAVDYNARGYRGGNIGEALARLFAEMNGVPSVLHIDEFDKWVYPERCRDYNEENSIAMYRNELQKEMLDFIEGKRLAIKGDSKLVGLETTPNNVLIVLSGSFSMHMQYVNNCHKELTIQTLVDHGMIPELAGRIGEVIHFDALTASDYENILSSYEHNHDEFPIVKLMKKKLVYVNRDVLLKKIAQKACDAKIGARYMNSFINKVIREKCLLPSKMIEISERDFDDFDQGTKSTPKRKEDYIL